MEAGDDLVLTPDLGGGYAMIGLSRAAPAVFNVQMSTQDVLSETIAIADSLGLRHSTTNETLDVDRVEDFHALEKIPANELLDSCPRTVKVIAELRKKWCAIKLAGTELCRHPPQRSTPITSQSIESSEGSQQYSLDEAIDEDTRSRREI